jgi:hypothetical protein
VPAATAEFRGKFKSNWNARQLLPPGEDAAIQFSSFISFIFPGCVLPLGAVGLNEWMRPCRKGFACFVPVVNGLRRGFRFVYLYNNMIGNNGNKIGAKSGGRERKGGAKEERLLCPWQKLSRARSDEHMAATGCCSLYPLYICFYKQNFLLIPSPDRRVGQSFPAECIAILTLIRAAASKCRAVRCHPVAVAVGESRTISHSDTNGGDNQRVGCMLTDSLSLCV